MKYAIRLVLVTILILGLIGTVSSAAGPEELDILNLPELKVTTKANGGKLLLSNSPEMVTSDGILYQDKAEGKIRLFFHHVNATETAKQLEVIIENPGPEIAHVSVQQYGLGGPGYDWMGLAKMAMTSYLAESRTYQINIPANTNMPLSSSISNTAILPNMLISGIFDFVVDQPVIIKVVMLPVLGDSWDFSRKAKILPPDDHHLRGTFEGANRQIVPCYDSINNAAKVVTLADNKIDHFLEGIDATIGTKVVNYGNYGVVYQLLLFSGNNNNRIAYYLNPRGGTYAGAIQVKYRNVNLTVPVPRDKTYFGDDKLIDFAALGIFDSNEPLWLTFSPPGSSNLPVKLVVLPL